MKLKAIVAGILTIVIIAYAWRFPVGAYKYYTDIREFEISCKENEQATKDLTYVNETNKELILKSYKAPQNGAVYDFCTELSNEGCKITKISSKKLTSGVATNIASVNSIDETHALNNADLLELVVIYDSLPELLENMQKYAVTKLIVYPTDKCAVITFIMLGGVA